MVFGVPGDLKNQAKVSEGLSNSHFGSLFCPGTDSWCAFVTDFLQICVIVGILEGPLGERFVFIVARRWTLEKVVKHKCENGSARHAIRMTLVPVGAQKISKTSKISKISKKTRMASNTPSAPEGTVADTNKR